MLGRNRVDKLLFEAAADVDVGRVARAASSCADRDWARFCVDRGLRELRTGTARRWVPRLTLIAGVRLNRVAEIMPFYEQFLAAFDTVSKADWHKTISEQGLQGNLLAQSGRLAQPLQEFGVEFERIVANLGPPEDGIVADIGCGGGLWALNLAKFGYRVIGTERYDFLVEAARQNAIHQGVEQTVEFRLDDICRSALPAAFCSRALCIGVTPTLADDAAFDALAAHLARITEAPAASGARRVIIGSNRWEPSRMSAVHGILAAAEHDRQSASLRFENAVRRLSLLEASWWLQLRHIDVLRRYFSAIEVIGETNDAIDGTRVELLLH